MNGRNGLPDLEFLSGRHVLLALSGGADSMALLDMLVRARDAGILRLSAAHYCHGIRGDEALADAEFAKHVCEAQNVAYYFGTGDVPAEAARTGEGLETAARRMRYAFLEEIRGRIRADDIALAHHADDQAETILMHLLRGSGMKGACGMEIRTGHLVRPLLSMRKLEIYDYLRGRNLQWREDATNLVADNPRNILRLEAVPALKKAYPAAVQALCRYGEIVREDDDLLERMTADFLRSRLKRGPFGTYLSLNGTEETALLRRAFRKLLGENAELERIGRLCALARKDRGAEDISADLRAEKYPGGMYLLNMPQPVYPEAPLNVPGTTALKGLGSVLIRGHRGGIIRNDPMRQALNPDALRGAVLRTRRPADRIRPLGMDGSRLLSDYLTDRKIDRPLRDHVPLIAVGDEILWAVGLGISRTAALNAQSPAVELTFIQEEFPC